ncbi:LysR family transcriptional regulator [Sphingomonas sp. AP4-R1]|uniref:LysR family transcriptional regulator n=1 Tax=Sphingomonas sp. AP4-R1 TaxID=2735134 RepID=UPI001493952D|nr:LysR family transcriptional regulator [Sphingomonas sp. AP4-R1]QJU58028.1 LysR family transcriptional regulator [Sphingomonas sp. AP4-R1]
MADTYDLNLRHLRMLAIIAENGSLSAAAKAASISQPALTQALAKLESAFGTALFDRTTAGVVPTTSGRRVLQRVDRALKSFALACRRFARTAPVSQFENYLTMAHVRGLMALAEAGSFLRAADEAGVSVPSLHRAVRDLEKLSGTVLVERRGRGVGLTRAGLKLARGFTIAVTELGAAIEETTDGGGRLSIGAMALSRSQLLPATLAELLLERPHIRVDVVEGSFLELVELLRAGKIDILIGALRDAPGRDLTQEPLFTDRLTIIGRAEHPLAGHFADFEQLADYSWIVARRASGLLDRWQQMFDRTGKPRPEAPIQCGSVALIRGLLLRTDFLTLLSTDQVRSEIEAGTLVRIESAVPDTMRTIGAITRRDWFPTKLQEAFMVALRRTGREAMPG